jgi:hypothetical protein
LHMQFCGCSVLVSGSKYRKRLRVAMLHKFIQMFIVDAFFHGSTLKFA